MPADNSVTVDKILVFGQSRLEIQEKYKTVDLKKLNDTESIYGVGVCDRRQLAGQLINNRQKSKAD